MRLVRFFFWHDKSLARSEALVLRIFVTRKWSYTPNRERQNIVGMNPWRKLFLGCFTCLLHHARCLPETTSGGRIADRSIDSKHLNARLKEVALEERMGNQKDHFWAAIDKSMREAHGLTRPKHANRAAVRDIMRRRVQGARADAWIQRQAEQRARRMKRREEEEDARRFGA